MPVRSSTNLVLGMLRLGAGSGYAIKKFSDLSTRYFWATSYAQVYPELARLEPVDHWAGLRPGTRDGLPLLGFTSPGVVVATGHYRNGILLAPVTAELVVQLVEGKTPDLGAFAPERFGDSPIPTGL